MNEQPVTPAPVVSAPEPVSPPSPTPAPEPAQAGPVVTAPGPAPTPPVNEKPKGKSKLLLFAVILLALLLPAAAYAGYMVSDKNADKKVNELNSKIATLESNEHPLPADAFKVSECIPNMGFHYMLPDSDPEYGPFLLVANSGKVIGVEYMASDDMYEDIPNTNPPISWVPKDSPMFGWKFDHTEMSLALEGHEGLTRKHVDVHNYTVTPEERQNACK